MRFLNSVCEMMLTGENRYSRRLPTYFHTSHPALCSALRRDPRWRQASANLYGGNKAQSQNSMRKSADKKGKKVMKSGYGGHFRGVSGFKYVGEKNV
jgi:hypothetical protein